MASSVQDAIAEIETAIATLEPELEGFRDFSRLNLEDATKPIVNSAITDYERRLTLLQNARTDLEALIADGYPALEKRVIPEAAYADLSQNVDTIGAAFSQFATTGAAASLSLQAGPPQPKR